METNFCQALKIIPWSLLNLFPTFWERDLYSCAIVSLQIDCPWKVRIVELFLLLAVQGYSYSTLRNICICRLYFAKWNLSWKSYSILVMVWMEHRREFLRQKNNDYGGVVGKNDYINYVTCYQIRECLTNSQIIFLINFSLLTQKQQYLSSIEATAQFSSNI